MFITKQEYRAPLNMQAISRAVIISLFITLILILITAIITFNFNQTSQWMKGIAVALYLIGCLLSGIISAKIAGFKGLLHGLFAGLIIFFAAFLVSLFIVPGHLVFGYIVKKFIVSLVTGAIGGILGIAIS